MSSKIVKTFSGTGQVSDAGSSVGIAAYDLAVYQRFEEGATLDGGAYNVEGTKKIEGTVRGNQIPIGQLLQLTTQEGYLLNFFLRDSSGSVVVTGTITDSSGKSVA